MNNYCGIICREGIGKSMTIHQYENNKSKSINSMDYQAVMKKNCICNSFKEYSPVHKFP